MSVKKDPKNLRVLFISSSGGHYKQLSRLQPLMDRYTSRVVTERDKTRDPEAGITYLLQVNRKEKLFPLKLFLNACISLRVMLSFHPDAVVTTGVLSVLPMCVLAKLFHKRLIYIESFAKITTPTETGKYVYDHHLCTSFFVQWKSMRRVYPEAVYAGNLY